MATVVTSRHCRGIRVRKRDKDGWSCDSCLKKDNKPTRTKYVVNCGVCGGSGWVRAF